MDEIDNLAADPLGSLAPEAAQVATALELVSDLLGTAPARTQRWEHRDRGNGVGHLWGHVQVIKPPVLLELSGPMFMSYPALNHVEVKLLEIPGGTKVTLRLRALGFLDETHRQNIGGGWKHLLDSVNKDFSKT